MIQDESDSLFADYLKALNQCCDAVKLTAYHTRGCAEKTEKAGIEASLTAYYVREITQGLNQRQ